MTPGDPTRLGGSDRDDDGAGDAGPDAGDRTPLDEVDAELRFHLDRKAERLMREGRTEEEARAEALRRFGDPARVKAEITRMEEGRMRGIVLWDRLRQDMRYALRQLARSPGFSAVVVLTLALGIGATTAIYSVVDGILFRPLPFPNPDQLTVVWADMTRAGGPVDEWMNFPNYADLKARARSFQAMGAWDGGPAALTGAGEPEEITTGVVTQGTLSEVLRVRPALGRGFRPADDRPGAPGTVLLTDGFWRRTLGADPSVLGRALTLDGEPYTIIGVLPAGFRSPFMTDADVWTPMRQDASDNSCGRGGACLHVVGRLADGTTLSAARTEADAIARQLEAEHPDADRNVGITLRPMRADMVSDARTGLLALLGAVAFVLLIACVNVANLLLVRATARGGELAVRSALGAGRRRLAGQLLTESALFAVLGGGAGLALAWIGTRALVSIAPAGTPRIEGVAMDGRVLAFAVGVTLLSGILFGLLPALRSARGTLRGLRQGGRGGAGRAAGMRARTALVAGQVALALVLLVGAGLLVQSFRNLRSRDLGFRPTGVLTFQLGASPIRYPDANALRTLVTEAESRLSALPGVRAVGTTTWLPLSGFGTDVSFNIEGRPIPEPGQRHAVWFRRITPGYPQAIGMRLVAGRWITASDDDKAPRVVVINEGLAARYFPGESPLGHRINLGNPSDPRWREIVGVAAEARYFGIRGDSRDALYLPYAQAPSRPVLMAVKTDRDPAALAGEVRTAIHGLDPSMPVAAMRPMNALVSNALGPDRFVTLLIGLFATVALILAVVGLYGVVSYGVGLRLREMGVRLALGAESGDIRGLVLGQSLRMVGMGVVLGVGGGLLLTRVLRSLLYGVSATDPWTYVGVAVGLTAVAGAASLIPAARAARVDPMRVLRTE